VSVYGTKGQHRAIHHYLKRLKALTHLQITIEAHILEVLLKEEYKSGINWQFMGQHLKGALLAPPSLGTPLMTLDLKGGGFAAMLGLMAGFGRVRTLSNPRLTVLNNQPALMKVARNEVFFRLEVDRVLSGDNKPDLETTTSHMQTIPIGLVMLVQASVDPDTHEITLALRPTLSRVVEMRDDPAVSLRSDNKIHSQIPVVQTRELDAILKVKPHHVMLMGGLMESHDSHTSQGLPLLHENSFWGTLFGQKSQNTSTSELIILLKAWVEEDPAQERQHPLPPLH
jgi:general secretion pathway protein D